MCAIGGGACVEGNRIWRRSDSGADVIVVAFELDAGLSFLSLYFTRQN